MCIEHIHIEILLSFKLYSSCVISVRPTSVAPQDDITDTSSYVTQSTQLSSVVLVKIKALCIVHANIT